MKTLALACVLSLCSVAAYAGTQVLPEPSLAVITGIKNLGSETPNDIVTSRGHQAMIGWSQDGTQLSAATYGEWTYGYHGSRVASWCGTLTWTITFNAEGNLNAIAPATFVSGDCTAAYGNNNLSFTGPRGYVATVLTLVNIFSPDTYLDEATLASPPPQ